jgi:HlyD family secretion protein
MLAVWLKFNLYSVPADTTYVKAVAHRPATLSTHTTPDSGIRMDQLTTSRAAETAPEIEKALGLDGKARRAHRRRLYWLLALLVTVLAGGAYYWFALPSSRTVYTTVAAKRADLTIEVSATGTLEPVTQVDVSSELSGIVRTVNVEENQQVKKGDVLARLDTAKLSAQVESARASVQAARAQVADAEATLAQAEQTYDRSSKLSARGMVSNQDLDTARTSRDRAKIAVLSGKAALAVADANLKLKQTDLANSVIYAPIDGVVLTRDVDPGQTVASSLQAPVLFVIAEDLKHMELKAAIDEADVGSVRKGQKADFTVDAYPDRTFHASISDIAFASSTTDGVVTYTADLAVDNSDLALRPGMTATVSVITNEIKDAVTVPNATFRFRPPSNEKSAGRGFSLTNLFMPRFRRTRSQVEQPAADGSRTLYVLKDGVPVAVHVKAGATDGERTQIVSGLEAGAKVVTGSSQSGK